MPNFPLKSVQNENTYLGELKIDVTSSIGLIPIQNATISISFTSNPNDTLETVTTNISGQTEPLLLPTPPFAYSQEPDEPRPYEEYNITVEAEGYEPAFIQGSQVLPDAIAIQPVNLFPLEISREPEEVIIIPDHTLYGEFPPKIPEEEIKPMDESGEIVLSRVVIPEYIVVHDGLPNDSSAPNYYVKYKDYIKNVVSCEIYATWPEC